MRVAVVTESFLPTLNGVTNSVKKVLDHLALRGHEAIVITPAAGSPATYAGFRVHEVPAIAYRQFPLGLPSPAVQKLLADFRPDVIHAASPLLLGAQAIGAGKRMGVPAVAIFQTDVAGYARRNHLAAGAKLAWKWIKWAHDGAALTLAPSTSALADLERAGVERLDRWGRGVDLVTYHPANKTSDTALQLRQRLAPLDEIVVGYVGRIAPEKQVERFAALRGMRGIRIVLVGDGPGTPAVKKALHGMPVSWLGALTGRDLAQAYASFDMFVHLGTEETFGQTIQEAHAAGLPVIAPHAGGPIDLVEHGVDGFRFRPGDDDELRGYVHTLALDHGLRARMGEAGRRAVLGRSWEVVCDELVGHYERVVDAQRVIQPAA